MLSSEYGGLGRGPAKKVGRFSSRDGTRARAARKNRCFCKQSESSENRHFEKNRHREACLVGALVAGGAAVAAAVVDVVVVVVVSVLVAVAVCCGVLW